MLLISIKLPNFFPQSISSLEKEYSLNNRVIWIGRGEDLLEKKDNQNEILNLGEMKEVSLSISRIHAGIHFSPLFWKSQFSPKYLERIFPHFPIQTLFNIWQFLKPSRKIIIKDAKSKTGIYRKIAQPQIQVFQGMQIVLGDSHPLVFHNQERFTLIEEVRKRVQFLQQSGYALLNQNQTDLTLSFWVISYKTSKFVLFNKPSTITIGRASNNILCIAESSISRIHAVLIFENHHWSLVDGYGNRKSSNGLWLRQRIITLHDEKTNKQSETVVKLGDILFSFRVIQPDFNFLDTSALNSSINKLDLKEQQDHS